MSHTVTRNDGIQISWVCALCGLNSVQNTESSYLRHLDDIHIDQLEEQQQINENGYQQWRDKLIKQAFKLNHIKCVEITPMMPEIS